MKNFKRFDRETEKTIEDLFLKMRSAKTKLRNYYELELELLKHIIECEKKITMLKDKRKKLRVRRKKLMGSTGFKNDGLKKTLIDIHNKENELRQFERSLRKRRTLLKRLGDSLAWILTNYDRAYIRSMGRKEPTGFIFGKTGFKLERLALEATFDENKQTISILHDLTNCLRTGDLTVVRLDRSPTILNCLELKTVRKKLARMRKRERRQKKYGEIILNYIKTGKSTQIYPGFTAISTRPKMTNHWSKMRLILREAKSCGYAYEKIEDALLYVAINPQIIEIEKVMDKCVKELDPPFTFGSLDRHRDGLFNHEPIFTFEVDTDQILDIIFGRLVLYIVLSFRKLQPLVKKAGYDLMLPNDPRGSKEGLKLVDERGKTIFMGPYPVEMLIYEGLDIKSFLDMINILKEHMS